MEPRTKTSAAESTSKELPLLEAFVAVVSAGSYTAAAKQTRVDKSEYGLYATYPHRSLVPRRVSAFMTWWPGACASWSPSGPPCPTDGRGLPSAGCSV